jgi:hypothetical protein
MQEQAILQGFEGGDHFLYFGSIETRRIRFQQKYLWATLPGTLYRNEVLLSIVGYACGALTPPWRPAFLLYTSHFWGEVCQIVVIHVRG